MGSEWHPCKLGELLEIKHGWAFKGEAMDDTMSEGPIVVAIGNFEYTGGFRFNSTKIKRYKGDYPDEYILKSGDILLAMTCQTSGGEILGIPGKIPMDNNIYLHNQRLGKVILRDNKKASIDYLYWLFLSQPFNHHLYLTATGTKILHTSPSKIESYEFLLPPKNDQQKIAHILCSLDDKIELNRRMNATLEAMAQALFKSWFVDFDPVIDNALAAGHPIPEALQERAEVRAALGDQRQPLPEAIRQQFPNRFVCNEDIGWVPEGWETTPMTSMVESVSDTFPLDTVNQIIFLNTGDILEGQILHSNLSNVSGLPGQAKKSIQAGDILYSEIRPKNKHFAFVDFDAKNYVVSTKLMVLRSKRLTSPLLPYFVLKQESTIEQLQLIAETRSGTFPQITYQQLDEVKITLPNNLKIIEFFESKILNTCHQKTQKLIIESQTLKNLRDTLLPKLLSGQLRIPEAEQQVADMP